MNEPSFMPCTASDRVNVLSAWTVAPFFSPSAQEMTIETTPLTYRTGKEGGHHIAFGGDLSSAEAAIRSWELTRISKGRDSAISMVYKMIVALTRSYLPRPAGRW